MLELRQILEENGIKTLNKAKKNAPKTSVGRELMNNLIERVSKQGNLIVEMDGHYVKKIRIKLSSNFFEPTEKNLSIMVKPFIAGGKYLMFNWKGVIIRASDVFGDGINRVTL